MTQNRSSAVMQQRSEPHDSLDDFPTPPWATRALCEHLLVAGRQNLGGMVVCEPAANRGHMVRPLSEYFGRVVASDVHDYGAGFAVRDYLLADLEPVDWTITNPPFRLAEPFIERALAHSRLGVAVLVRTAFLEGVGRYERLFKVLPPTHVLQFVERVNMFRGQLDAKGSKPMACAWIIWQRPFVDAGTRLAWVPPCRRQLEREGDYPTRAQAGGAP